MASSFIISNDDALKIASISASSLASILMIAIFLSNGAVTGRFTTKTHPVQLSVLMLPLWALVSLLISYVLPSKAVPQEVYSTSWATGLNSPSYRGLSFLIRLFLSISAIEFVISSISTRKRYITVLNITLLFYAVVVTYGFFQILFYVTTGIKIGRVITYPFFRIAGYVGEPQTFGILIISMLFLVAASIKFRFDGCWFSTKALKCILFFSIAALIFTFSVSMIMGLMAAFALNIKKVSSKTIVFICLGFAISLYAFYDLINSILIDKFFSETFSLNSRTLTWNIGYTMITDNLLTGVGIGQSPLLTESISKKINLSFDSLNFNAARVPVLNSYLEWTAETGIVGASILAYIAYKIWKLGRCKKKAAYGFVKFSFGGALLAMAVSANSFGGLFYIGCFNLVFALYVAGLNVFPDNKNLV